MARHHPIVVTGLGGITPLGPDVPALWSALLAGRSGIRRLETEWAERVPVRIAAPVVDDPVERLGPVRARSLDRVQQLALVAALEAWQDAGSPDVDRERLAVAIGSGMGGIATLLTQHDVMRT